MKRFTLKVQDTEIKIKKIDNEDYICITDMVKNIENGASLVEKWIRNRNTIEFLGLWETINNPNFNQIEFNAIMGMSGLNRFTISAKQWIEKTNAKGISAQAGRYGGTYAHKDIAFEFGSWISPAFKLYLIKEYQNMSIQMSDKRLLDWDVKRVLSKVNYQLHTDAVKNYVIPKSSFSQLKNALVYASEADFLNLIIFGCTAKQWEKANPILVANGLNMRDAATINQLNVLANMESYNAELIKLGYDQQKRKSIIHRAAKEQLARLAEMNSEQNFSKLSHLGNPKYLK